MMTKTVEDLIEYRKDRIEHMWILGYDENDNFIKSVKVSDGDEYACYISVQDILVAVRENNFHHIVLVHNHPLSKYKIDSSLDDRNMTVRMLRNTKKHGIKIYDHLIFGEAKDIYSFREAFVNNEMFKQYYTFYNY